MAKRLVTLQNLQNGSQKMEKVTNDPKRYKIQFNNSDYPR